MTAYVSIGHYMGSPYGGPTTPSDLSLSGHVMQGQGHSFFQPLYLITEHVTIGHK